ncbi:MAG: bifunctional sulfate adenylyltransferase/adenylylsulfate kinase [Acidimicrobiia bacterium]|nr:bifunctional sulfate adenylyltransferase/adenylylsulfate kinase [Acidimicrobiia bacterium]
MTIEPHGGALKNLMAADDRIEDLIRLAGDLPSWDLTHRQLNDIELLLTGVFSPLEGFMTESDYASVVSDMRLEDGTVWPIPITLDVSEDFAGGLDSGAQVALRDQEGVVIAILTVADAYTPDKQVEAASVFGTTDTAHPAVNYLYNQAGPVYLGGSIVGVQLPTHYDFEGLRLTPSETRARFQQAGWDKVVAFQTRNPMHRAHLEITLRAARHQDAKLLVHPVVGMTKPGDIDHFTRVRVYQSLLHRYPADTADLALLPLAMRMAGPREAVWHAIIRKNFGVTHFIVGRDHAGPGNDATGDPFYGPYDAQELLSKYEDEIGVKMVPFQMMVYVQEEDAYLPMDEVPEGEHVLSISGTEFREKLAAGDEIPEWFSYPEVVTELRRTHKPRTEQGFVVFFTGLSGSGKSTIANALRVKLLELGGRPITLLDGDIVRKHLSSELGFSREHRDLNVSRIGFVASEIAKHGGIAIAAPIAPYDAVRKHNRSLVSSGNFVLVHVATPLEVCEARDRKGLYALARAGKIKEFTGISDPYEEPDDAEIVLATDGSPAEAADIVVEYLRADGYF